MLHFHPLTSPLLEFLVGWYIVGMAAVDDEMNEDSVYSLLVDSLNSDFNEEALLPEEVAWADCCLNKDADSTETDWSSVQDVLLEILSSHPGGPDSAVAESAGQTANDDVLHSRSNVESLGFHTGSDEDEDLIDGDIGEAESLGSSEGEEEEEDDDDLMVGNRKARARGKGRLKSVFQPHYTEDSVKEESPDSGLHSSFTTAELELSSEDLFKVWDLEIPDEEDEFTAELNKALYEIPPPTESTVDAPPSLENFVNVSVDDLIAGLGDLSLEQDIK